MEFFEKAHVTKSNKKQLKSKKNEDSMKHQLKKMLYGYHQSDNDLIKSSAALKNYIDESSSVSGYSDLDVTNSSNEADPSLVTATPEASLSFKSNTIHNKKLNFGKSEGTNCDSGEDSNDSMSMESMDYDEDMKSLSNDASKTLDSSFLEESEESSSDSFIVTSTDVDTTSDDNSEFDADGALAAKILEKMNEAKDKNKKTKKRKTSDLNVNKPCKAEVKKAEYKGPFRFISEDEEELDDLSIEMASIRLPKTKEYSGPYRPKTDTSDDDVEVIEDKVSSCNENSNDSVVSSPYVSVIAADIENQSLADILGEYTHPTMRNLPSDNMFSNNNTGLFTTDNVSVVDIQTEDDMDSLIPEIDNDITIEDFDENLQELDTSTQPNEESTPYDTTLQSEDLTERENSMDSIDPTLENPVKVYYGKNNTCVFVMKHPTEFYIHGKAKVKSLGGTVEILGYTLQDSPCEIYAPNYNYAQYIRTVESQNAYYGLFGKLTGSGLSVATAEEIVTTLGEFDGVLTLQPLKTRQMDFVEQNFTVTDLFSKLNKNVDNYFKKASEILGCSLYLSRPWKSFEENFTWKDVIQCGMKDQSRGIVCGGKGTGKTTFLRYYVNKLLAKGPVLVVDLDPGQSEFTVAGNISATVVTEPLLGPNFTHLRQPELMLHLGMINTMDNTTRYAAAIAELIAHCCTDERLRSLPWIVNTMGMTNAMGLKFMSLITLHTQPTFLLQFDSRNVKKRFDFHLYPNTIKNLCAEKYKYDRLFNISDVELEYDFFMLHYADCSVKNNFSLAPRDERYLNFLAYFGDILNSRSEGLLGVVPYEVSLNDLNIGLNMRISEESITKVINGKVVALCQQAPKRRLFTLADTPLTCVGAGLVRGVDWEREMVYIITASGTALEANTLVYSDWAPELRGPGLAALPAGRALPFRAQSEYTQRRLTSAPKRRFNPLQLLKMSRNA